ncbi:hypothetical protein T08_10335 [Trichinella sp. T8]|nr:hypothetical protein T08_10335 [Trichinella sp. T8]
MPLIRLMKKKSTEKAEPLNRTTKHLRSVQKTPRHHFSITNSINSTSSRSVYRILIGRFVTVMRRFFCSNAPHCHLRLELYVNWRHSVLLNYCQNFCKYFRRGVCHLLEISNLNSSFEVFNSYLPRVQLSMFECLQKVTEKEFEFSIRLTGVQLLEQFFERANH